MLFCIKAAKIVELTALKGLKNSKRNYCYYLPCSIFL